MKNFIKKIGAVFLSLTVAASLLAGCGAKTEPVASAAPESKGTFRTLDEIKSSGTINIGVFSDKSPFWGTAEMGDLVRGALQSIPAIQHESAQALGMNPLQVYGYIILPQTVRRLIPLSINLITRMIKTTNLVMMIGIVEVLKVAQQIIEANRRVAPNAAFGVFAVVFLLYFLICWPISRLAGYLEKRWS